MLAAALRAVSMALAVAVGNLAVQADQAIPVARMPAAFVTPATGRRVGLGVGHHVGDSVAWAVNRGWLAVVALLVKSAQVARWVDRAHHQE
jgi:hypothetical protein